MSARRHTLRLAPLSLTDGDAPGRDSVVTTTKRESTPQSPNERTTNCRFAKGGNRSPWRADSGSWSRAAQSSHDMARGGEAFFVDAPTLAYKLTQRRGTAGREEEFYDKTWVMRISIIFDTYIQDRERSSSP